MIEEEESSKICECFFVKHYKGKKKQEIQKTKLPKHVERIFLQNPSTRDTGKKREIFWRQQNREERCPFFHRKLQTAEKHTKKKKSERKRRNRLVRKKAHQQKGENTRTEKHTENNEKGGKERVKRRFLQSKIVLFHKNIFQKKRDKSDKSRNKKGFLKTLKKGGKENENKKKRKNSENLRKTRFAKVQKREKTEKTIKNTHQKRCKQRKF